MKELIIVVTRSKMGRFATWVIEPTNEEDMFIVASYNANGDCLHRREYMARLVLEHLVENEAEVVSSVIHSY